MPSIRQFTFRTTLTITGLHGAFAKSELEALLVTALGRANEPMEILVKVEKFSEWPKPGQEPLADTGRKEERNELRLEDL